MTMSSASEVETAEQQFNGYVSMRLKTKSWNLCVVQWLCKNILTSLPYVGTFVLLKTKTCGC